MSQLIVITLFVCALMITSVKMQRSTFAGSRPNGYKDRLQSNNARDNNGIADRFGDNTNTVVAGTTEKLPHLALGDREIVDRLNTFPVDQRPFWLINAEAIEAQKNQSRPASPTNPSNPTNQNTGIVNRFGTGSVAPQEVSYASVVYPIEMTAEQRQQAQQMFQNQIQQVTSNNQAINSNPLPSRINLQQPVVVQQQTINGGPKQTPQPVQGRPTSGYNG